MLHFREHGKKAIEKVAKEQPASYLKILALLVPREHKIEHSNALKNLTDEQLDAMIEYLKASLEAQAQTAQAIEGESVPALPAPAALEQPRKRPNRLLEHVNTAIGPRERRPRQRKVPSPVGA